MNERILALDHPILIKLKSDFNDIINCQQEAIDILNGKQKDAFRINAEEGNMIALAKCIREGNDFVVRVTINVKDGHTILILYPNNDLIYDTAADDGNQLSMVKSYNSKSVFSSSSFQVWQFENSYNKKLI